MTSDTTRFTFKSKGMDVEFEGQEAFVSAQIEHVRAQFLKELADALGTEVHAPAAATGSAPAAGAPAATPATAPTLEDFYRRAKSREGRGALQETILIFAYFLREFRSKEEFSIENLNACFSLVGVSPPKSLANTLGIMKRNQKFFHSGSRRGHYALTDKGTAYVRRLIGEQ
jgi:hypothetical protein